MKELHLSIVSPEKSIFDGNVKIVTLPGMMDIQGGFVEMSDGTVSACVS